MGTTNAVVGSSLSPNSIHTIIKSFRSNYYSPTDHLHFRITPTRALTTSSSFIYSHNNYIEPLVSFHKWRRVLRISAAVAEEEVVALTEEQQQKEVDDEDVVNTKLYFGNLPYSVDSAQLAGIIQDFASPELIEVPFSLFDSKS